MSAATSHFGDLSDVEPHLIGEGVVARAVEGERVTLALVELAPGSVVAEHAHENEQVGILVSGSLRFRIGDENSELAAGGTWSIPAQVPHEVEAGPAGAVVVECFVPSRADWVRLERGQPSALRWAV